MVKGTKERILEEALRLFAQNGYLATSMSNIAEKVGITKAALYKHYDSKQEILDCIVERMNQMDEERIKEYHMPHGTFKEMTEEYKMASLEKIIMISQAQVQHWLEDNFSCDFRRMITLEQYRDENMSNLYQQYLVNGPINYMEKLFSEMVPNQNAKRLAIEFYGPMYLMMSMYDGGVSREEIMELIKEHINHFDKRMKEDLSN